MSRRELYLKVRAKIDEYGNTVVRKNGPVRIVDLRSEILNLCNSNIQTIVNESPTFFKRYDTKVQVSINRVKSQRFLVTIYIGLDALILRCVFDFDNHKYTSKYDATEIMRQINATY